MHLSDPKFINSLLQQGVFKSKLRSLYHVSSLSYNAWKNMSTDREIDRCIQGWQHYVPHTLQVVEGYENLKNILWSGRNQVINNLQKFCTCQEWHL